MPNNMIYDNDNIILSALGHYSFHRVYIILLFPQRIWLLFYRPTVYHRRLPT